ncbi:MAG: division/cell wall cluster transcriptional repressor MraZ [Patescibacteria group bacterium]|nr:division/cell wall cluster transcriptional repressor MraZ [Patescibacteria group bacterium]
MFIGEYRHNVDQKGRLAVPVKFKGVLSKGVVVTRGFDKCLFIYTKTEWEKFVKEKVAKLPLGKVEARSLQRRLLGGAMDLGLDKQGRIVLPDYLRKFSNIKKNVVIAGLLDHLEIWDAMEWNKEKTKIEKSNIDIAEKLEELNF